MSTNTETSQRIRVAEVLRAGGFLPGTYAIVVVGNTANDRKAIAVFAHPGTWVPAIRVGVASLLSDEFGADNVSFATISGNRAIVVKNA